MAKLEIVVTVDGQEVERFDFDNSSHVDKNEAFRQFVSYVYAIMIRWSYNKFFGKG